MYCSLMKLVNAVGGILFLAMIAYIAYLFLAGGKKPFMGGAVVVDEALIFLLSFIL